MQTSFEKGQQNQLSDDDNGFPVESTSTVCVNDKPDPIQMYMRSCKIYANGSVVADSQVISIRDKTRAHKKFDPVEMYWRSRKIYGRECTADDAKNAPVVLVGLCRLRTRCTLV